MTNTKIERGRADLQSKLESYFRTLAGCLPAVEATNRNGRQLPLADAVQWAIETARKTHIAGNKLMFIGNGGSAGIASHMAIDYTKNGNLRALAFNDAAALTCLGNDLGYENVFAKQIESHGRAGDLLIAISSSGRSPNILGGVETARTVGVSVLTLSGFKADNPLRRLGDMNLYVPNGEYGFVEISHLTLCSAILDLACGWPGEPAA